MQANDFSTGSVKRRILAQAIPLTLAQLVQLLYNIVDRIYIGHLPGVGSTALTGLGITFPVIVLIAAFTALFGQGGAPLFSIARGQKNEREAQDIMLDHRLNPDDISRTELPEIDDLLHARERGMNCFNILNIVPPPKDPRTLWVCYMPPSALLGKWYMRIYRYFPLPKMKIFGN